MEDSDGPPASGETMDRSKGGGCSTNKPMASTSSAGSRRFRVGLRQPYQGSNVDDGCTHEEIMKDMCTRCGKDLKQLHDTDRKNVLQSASISMVHSIPELKVSAASAQELGQQDTERLLRERKLVLLVDLDQTVIHTTNEDVPVDMPEVHHFQLYGGKLKGEPWYHTKFRPEAVNFLEKMSKTFELHICTFGARMYAHTIAKLLDPTEKLFSHRILSRDECLDPHSKTGNLKALFPTGDSLVAIIDDREDVWNFSPNVVSVKPYLYFKNTGDINSPYKPSEANVFQTFNVSSSKDSGASSSNETSLKPETSSTAQDETMEVESSTSTVTTKDASTAPDLVSSSLTSDVDKDSTNSSSQDMTAVSSAVDESSPVPSVCLSESSTEESPSSTPVDSPAVSSASPAKEGKADEEDEVKKEYIDYDDYLFHLEKILAKIHTAFYKEFDDKNRLQGEGEAFIIPDLKKVIPRVKQEVLRGVNIVFSGVIPTNVSAEKSKPYQVAKALGANVNKDVMFESPDVSPTERTTHVVAAKYGTLKVNKALKSKKIWIVNPHWLFSCNERWEKVEEKLFLLKEDDDFQIQKKMKEPLISSTGSSTSKHNNIDSNDKDVVSSSSSSSSSSTERTPFHDLQPEAGSSGQVIDLDDDDDDPPVRPLLMSQFSHHDLEAMGREVEEACSSDSSSESDNELGTLPLKRRRLNESSEEEDSLSGGDAPKGWLDRRRSMSPDSRAIEEVNEGTVDSIDYGANLSESSESNSSNDSLDATTAADLVEREFLGE